MKAGTRDRLIVIERATVVQDGFGEEIPTWAEVAREWARVFYGRGNERREAAADRAESVITFRVLANSNTRAITATDRILYDGLIWNLKQPSPVMRGEIEIEAVAAP
jgi:SPP1 family predicted phage head-tail adaptor